MSPIIIIATHQRFAITLANIKSLYPYTVVLVVTDIYEAEQYRGLDNVQVVMAPNNPLGAKWQAGVDTARQMPHSHLVITGSDDIISRGYIKEACEMEIDFVGLRAWYILHDKKLYYLEYRAAGDLPLGGGRVYSKRFLEGIGYQIFDTRRDKLLDDLGWEAARKGTCCLLYDPRILAVKGDWPVMNPVDLKHRNIRLLATFKGVDAETLIKTNFNYECSGLL